jgi:hypothetical protein
MHTLYLKLTTSIYFNTLVNSNFVCYRVAKAGKAHLFSLEQPFSAMLILIFVLHVNRKDTIRIAAIAASSMKSIPFLNDFTCASSAIIAPD